MDQMEPIKRAVMDLDYVAWAHGFRSTPGGTGETLYTEGLGKKRIKQRDLLLKMIRDALRKEK